MRYVQSITSKTACPNHRGGAKESAGCSTEVLLMFCRGAVTSNKMWPRKRNMSRNMSVVMLRIREVCSTITSKIRPIRQNTSNTSKIRPIRRKYVRYFEKYVRYVEKYVRNPIRIFLLVNSVTNVKVLESESAV